MSSKIFLSYTLCYDQFDKWNDYWSRALGECVVPSKLLGHQRQERIKTQTEQSVIRPWLHNVLDGLNIYFKTTMYLLIELVEFFIRNPLLSMLNVEQI